MAAACLMAAARAYRIGAESETPGKPALYAGCGWTVGEPHLQLEGA
jgi:hypothetical protein